MQRESWNEKCHFKKVLIDTSYKNACIEHSNDNLFCFENFNNYNQTKGTDKYGHSTLNVHS